MECHGFFYILTQGTPTYQMFKVTVMLLLLAFALKVIGPSPVVKLICFLTSLFRNKFIVYLCPCITLIKQYGTTRTRTITRQKWQVSSLQTYLPYCPRHILVIIKSYVSIEQGCCLSSLTNYCINPFSVIVGRFVLYNLDE